MERAGDRNGENMKIKICGLFRPEDIEYANQVQPDYAGFVFAKSRRQITIEQARKFRKMLSPGIRTVGVFVNAPPEEIISLLEEGTIDMAQLHGDETEEDIQYIQAVTSRPVIKAVKIRHRNDAEAWLDTHADYLLFDSGAGSGETFDWSLLEDVNREFFLAGGLNPDNILQALAFLKPYAIDLSSGVETERIKDFDKMKRAVELVHNI